MKRFRRKVYMNSSKRPFKMDRFNIIIGCINIALIIVNIGIAIWSVNKAEDIAERSGNFDKGELTCLFSGYQIEPLKRYDVYFGFNFNDSVLHTLDLPLSVGNSGKKTLEDISLLIRYPSIANIMVADSFLALNTNSIDTIQRKTSKFGGFDNVSFKLNTINPLVNVNVSDLITIRNETIFLNTFPVKTRDSSIVNIAAAINYALKVDATISAKDALTKSFNFNFNFRKRTNLDSLIIDVIHEKANREKDNYDQFFFVTIPTIDKKIQDKEFTIENYSVDSSITKLCVINIKDEQVTVFNIDGSVYKIIDYKAHS